MKNFTLPLLLTVSGLLLIFLAFTNICRAQQPGSLDLSFNPTDAGFGFGYGADDDVDLLAIQPDGKVIIAGSFSKFNNQPHTYIARLTTSGDIDNTFNAGALLNEEIYALAVQADGKILVGGRLASFNGTGINGLARLNPDGSVDTGFNSGVGGSSNFIINDIALQTDGKILIVGSFTEYDGVSRNRIARLNADGTLDTSFDPGTGPNSTVRRLAVQPDGRVLISGGFSGVNGLPRNRIARLNTDGSIDAGFNPVTQGNVYAQDFGFQSDGKIIIVGDFSSVNTYFYHNIIRITPAGDLDLTFSPGTSTNYQINSVVIQPDDKIIIGGDFTTFNYAPHSGIARLHANGPLDASYNTGSGTYGDIYSLTRQPDGKLVAAGSFIGYNGFARNKVARINTDGSNDPGYNTSTGANAEVRSITAQPDGKLIVTGAFTGLNNALRQRIARVFADGTLDTTFSSGNGPMGDVYAVAIQPDGKIIAGGNFVFYSGTWAQNLVRLNANGAVDTSFNTGTGIYGIAYRSLVQPDGKIVVAGKFSSYNGISRVGIARLNTDGTLDATFDPGLGTNAALARSIWAIVQQPDGKLIIGGNFLTYNGTTSRRLARINTDGSLDLTFNVGNGFNDQVQALYLQPDGKLLVGGSFTSYNGTPQNRIARLNPDGTLDTSFNPGAGPDAEVSALVVQPDGKVIIGGKFTQIAGSPQAYLGRLNADGTPDIGFNTGTGPSNFVNALALQPNERVVLAGNFTSYNGTGRNHLARVHSGQVSSAPDQRLTQVSVYPNPTTGVVWLDLSEISVAEKVQVSLLNLLGQTIQEMNTETGLVSTLNLSGKPEGVYVVRLQIADRVMTQKIVLHR